MIKQSQSTMLGKLKSLATATFCVLRGARSIAIIVHVRDVDYGRQAEFKLATHGDARRLIQLTQELDKHLRAELGE